MKLHGPLTGLLCLAVWTLAASASGQVSYRVKNINPNGSSDPRELLAHNGILYFVAQTSTFGSEVWRSDGTGWPSWRPPPSTESRSGAPMAPPPPSAWGRS
jgi:hypothetical protein